MKSKYLLITYFIIVGVFAQESNVFHNRNFWKTNPSIQTIEKFIAEGNDITSLNKNAFDAVTWALIEKTDNSTIKYLLSKEGNDVNKLTHDGRTYIFWAAYKNNLEMMQYLIDKGAKTDIIDSHGYSVLNFAASTGQKDKELYEFLIKHGANPLLEKKQNGANALLLVAPFLDDLELINYFKSLGINEYSTDNSGNGLFNYAAKGGNILFLKQLIEKGYPYKDLNNHGGNAFLMASQGRRGHTNSIEVYQFLESVGLEPNVVGKEGKNPLHNLAYRIKDKELFRFFLNKNVDVNHQDKNGNTPFMNAARNNELDVLQLMQPFVADINLKNNKGQTALSFAFSRNNFEVVEYLLQHKADITVKDKTGNSLAYYLLDTYDSKETEEFEAKLNLLKSHNIPLNEVQSEGNTLLHFAVQKENLDLIKRIKDFNIEVDAKNDEGNTALHLAAMKAKDRSILEYLIEMGASKTIKTDFEESVYDLANENEILIEKNTDLEFLK
jgi:ankyrin repeat protein